MFTGLVADLGRLEALDRGPEGARMAIATSLAGDLALGDSVAVNGCCLTVTGLSGESFDADVMNQSLELTALGRLEPGDAVNLEPALRAGDRMGGHIVQGHVDGVGEITSASEDGFALRVRVALPPELSRFVVEHGSIALEGVSLTVAALDADTAEVSLIPETRERTNFGRNPHDLVGSSVNVEVDVIARYAERLLQPFERQRSSPNG